MAAKLHNATNWKSKALDSGGSLGDWRALSVNLERNKNGLGSSCHHLTYSPAWNRSSCFCTEADNGTEWQGMATLQLAAKRCLLQRGVKERSEGREQCGCLIRTAGHLMLNETFDC